MTKLRGVIAPFTTPFSEDGSINYSLIKPQVDWLIENGVHGLAAGGSTGEGHALTRDEYLSVIRETINAIDNRIPLVAGIIANSTSEVIERGLSVKEMNVEALQITPPSYLFKPDDDAMVKHFDEISKKCNLPILIYNVVPWCYLSPDLLLRIMEEVPGVLGVKQSAGDMKLLADLLAQSQAEDLIFTAVDALLYPSFQLGAKGAIAALLAACPHHCVKLWNASKNAEHKEALVLHNQLLQVWNSTEHDLLPACVKYIQKLQGCPNSYPRKPMPYPNESIQHSIKIALANAAIDIR